MVINNEIEDYYECPRCKCDSLNGMVPCEDFCEAKITGKIVTITKIIKESDKSQIKCNKDNYKN